MAKSTMKAVVKAATGKGAPTDPVEAPSTITITPVGKGQKK